MNVITNHQPRQVLTFDELTKKEQEEFEYHGKDEPGNFVRYKGIAYDLDDTEGNMQGRLRELVGGNWDTYVSETFFSGVLFKYTDDFEEVICGRYFT